MITIEPETDLKARKQTAIRRNIFMVSEESSRKNQDLFSSGPDRIMLMMFKSTSDVSTKRRV